MSWAPSPWTSSRGRPAGSPAVSYSSSTPFPCALGMAGIVTSPGRPEPRRRAHAGLPDDRGPGGRHLGAVAGPGRGLRGARPGGPVPLRPLRVGDGHARAGLARRLGHPGRAGRPDQPHPPGHAGLAGHLPAPIGAGQDGGHRRPRLRRPGRAGARGRLARGRAPRLRLRVPTHPDPHGAPGRAAGDRHPLLDRGRRRVPGPPLPGPGPARPAQAGAAPAPHPAGRRGCRAQEPGPGGPLRRRVQHRRRPPGGAARAAQAAAGRLARGRPRPAGDPPVADDRLRGRPRPGRGRGAGPAGPGRHRQPRQRGRGGRGPPQLAARHRRRGRRAPPRAGGGRGRPRLRTFRSLDVRNFRLFFFGHLISSTGTWMQQVGQDWLVLRLTDAPLPLGVTLALQFAPILVLGGWAGLIADRVDKRRLLLATQTAMAVLALALGVLTATGAVRLWMVYALALLLGCATAFDMPARQAFVSEMVGPDRVANAVGLNSASFNTARVVGPAVAGALIAVVGIAPAFFINAVSYLALIGGLLAMDPDRLYRRAAVERGRGQIRAGLRYVWATPVLRSTILLVAVVGMLGLNYRVALPLLARFAFDGGPGAYGALAAILAAVSVVAAPPVAPPGRPTRLLLIGSAAAFGLLSFAAAAATTMQ